MRPGEHQVTPSVAEVVRHAVDVCYPAGSDAALDEFLLRFEDRDEPVTALATRERVFFEQAGALQGQGSDPALTMAAAVATYLAFRRDQSAEDDLDLLRLAARAEFGSSPPEDVAAWLAAQGVEL